MRLLPTLLTFLVGYYVLASVVSVDDTDPSIQYSGSGWEPSSQHSNSLDFNGSHTVSTTITDTATFTFIGVGVSYLSPLWPYNVTVDISLDGASADFVSLLDPAYAGNETAPGGSETVQWDVRWSKDNLVNGNHSVVVSAPPGGQFVVVDGFYYTITDTSTTSTVASPTTSPTPTSSQTLTSVAAETSSTGTPLSSATAAASPTTAAAAHRSFLGSKTATIAIGVSAGVGGLLFLAAVLFLCLQQVHRRHSSASMYRGSVGSAGSHDMMSQHGTQPLVADPSVAPGTRRYPSQHSQLSYARDTTAGEEDYSSQRPPIPVSYHDTAAAQPPADNLRTSHARNDNPSGTYF